MLDDVFVYTVFTFFCSKSLRMLFRRTCCTVLHWFKISREGESV